jgi:SAM-dependent methyltransferase
MKPFKEHSMYSAIADFYHEIFPINQGFLNFIQDYLGPSGSRVLDLGCGPGDYIHALSKNHQGLGIDANPEMIHLANARNQGKFHTLSFTRINSLEGPFVCAWCIGNSLSYLPHDLETAFFKTLSGLLSESGYFILQVVNWNRYALTGKMDFPIKVLSDGRTFHRTYEPSKGKTVLFQTRLQKGEEIIGRWEDTLYPKPMEHLSSMMESSGLNVLSEYGDYDKSPFSPATSPAVILLAQKKVS